MTNFYVTYVIKDRETRDAFYNEVKKCRVAEKSRSEEGCIRYEFFYPADNDSNMFLWEQWESREAQAAHLKTPHYADFAEIKNRYKVETNVIAEDQVIS